MWCLAICERRTAAEYRCCFGHVALVLNSVSVIYAAYLGGIIVFWFSKPFKVRRSSSRDQIRFWIALVGAVIVNMAYIAGLSIGYWDSGARLDDIIDARDLVLWLSFIVAPANLYFFGIRRDATGWAGVADELG